MRIADCKLRIEKCKLKIENCRLQHADRQSAICNFQFAICSLLLVAVLVPANLAAASTPVTPPAAEAVIQAQPKVVKIYGAGGLRGLEAYQTGLLISAEGHVLTAWSYVLDSDFITVILHDGRKFEAKLLGFDPRLEVAVLKIDGAGLPHFDLRQAVEAEAGTRVLALEQSFRRGDGERAGERAAGDDLGQDAPGGPSRRVRDSLRRPGLRARRGDQQSRRGRRRPGHAARGARGHARQGAPQLAEQHLAELRGPHRAAPRVGRADPGREARGPQDGRGVQAAGQVAHAGDAGDHAGAGRCGPDAPLRR